MPACSVAETSCTVRGCRCSVDPNDLPRAHAVIIDAVYLQLPNPPEKYSNQVWIVQGIEPPTKYRNGYFRSQLWSGMFNWTMTYRLDSDVISPYDVLVHQRRGLHKNFTDIALRKSKPALWVVSNCNTQSKRMDYVRELRKYYNVDIYGRCGPRKERASDNLDMVHKDYRFYLAFENSLCDDYITEKVFKLFKEDMDVVPVVRGGANYASLLPPKTYINTAEFQSPKQLADHLRYLEKNITAYGEILHEKSKYISVGDMARLSSPLCDICLKLHSLDIFSNYYYNVSQWLERSTCHTPADC